MSALTERLLNASNNKSAGTEAGASEGKFDNTLSISVGILDDEGTYVPAGFLKLEKEADAGAEEHRANFLELIKREEWMLTVHKTNSQWGTVFIKGVYINEGTIFPAKENLVRKIKAQSIETLMAAKAEGRLILSAGNGYRYTLTDEQIAKAV